MAQTYSQIQKQIATLQAQADKARARELEGVVSRIKEAIAAYGITAEMLYDEAGQHGRVTRSKQLKKRRPSTKIYRDDAGHTWTGRGPRPGWLRDAIAGGKSLEEFLA